MTGRSDAGLTPVPVHNAAGRTVKVTRRLTHHSLIHIVPHQPSTSRDGGRAQSTGSQPAARAPPRGHQVNPRAREKGSCWFQTRPPSAEDSNGLSVGMTSEGSASRVLQIWAKEQEHLTHEPPERDRAQTSHCSRVKCHEPRLRTTGLLFQCLLASPANIIMCLGIGLFLSGHNLTRIYQ